jgi:hypothetical protein
MHGRPVPRSAPSEKPVPRQSQAAATEGMQAHMKSMHELHEKLMAATTREEHDALMPEHLTTMRESMAMMREVSASGGRHLVKENPASILLTCSSTQLQYRPKPTPDRSCSVGAPSTTRRKVDKGERHPSESCSDCSSSAARSICSRRAASARASAKSAKRAGRQPGSHQAKGGPDATTLPLRPRRSSFQRDCPT